MSAEIHESRPIHPGRFVKTSVLPDGLSVKEAAKLLGVGRPALSNLLNENASLSPEMALRLEKAFGAKRDDLLKLQSEYDEFQLRGREKTIAVRAYARSAVEIRAIDIENWSGRIEARSSLPALLRKLVHSTGANLTHVDFPAYDNSQRKGWDGQAETDTATPWIPVGKSGWEFGCDANAARKAEDDYEARTANTSAETRAETTFVFVTPKNWSGKDAWAKKKAAARDWKNVRALDASDLEQWLEQSIAAQSWMAEQLGIGSDDLLSLDQCWKRWASVTHPDLNRQLFGDAVESHKKTLADWLKQPPSRPLIVTSASQEEALASLVCLFEAAESSVGACYDRAVAIRSLPIFHAALKALPNYIAIVASAEVEKELAGIQKSQHTVIVRNLTAVESEADIVIDLPSHHTFTAALTSMGFDENAVHRYARESGQSPTILRRRLSQVQAIRFPQWSQDKVIVRKLIPLALAGVWKSDCKADQEILSHVANAPYVDIERDVAEILQSDDTPLWSVDRYRGLISKLDVLFAISSFITRDDLERFFDAAGYVLCQEDPALDLPEDKRWTAAWYGKTRDHSGAIRQALCETLVLMSVHGNNLFQKRLGVDVETKVNLLIRDLLKPFYPKKWLSQQGDLPRYAEAAPDEFLDILEEDLKSGDPKVYALLKPMEGDGLFGGCPRSGLLWALELLAWKPERLTRVAFILAKLCEQRIDDNWGNRPENSLKSILRPWMPQTAASVDQRVLALEKIASRFPAAGWMLCVDQFDPGSTIGTHSHRPSWRNDAAGSGQPVAGAEEYQSRRKALDIALAWPAHNEKTLGDLVQRLQTLPDEDQEKVWDLIAAWVATVPSENLKAVLREQIRRSAFTRRGRKRKLGDKAKDRARQAYELLQPHNLLERHKWLFAEHWVNESSEELEEEEFDYNKRDERIAKLRVAALQEIWSQHGLPGVKDLCASGNAAGTIGWLLADSVLQKGKVLDSAFELICSRNSEPLEAKLDNCIGGILTKLTGEGAVETIPALVKLLCGAPDASDNILRLFRCAPFHGATWVHVDDLHAELRKRYWSEIVPTWSRHEPSELNRLIDELIEVGRPRAAFSVAHVDWKNVETERLIRLLRAVATCDSEPEEHYRLQAHNVSRAFQSLEKRGTVSVGELAQLEFTFIKALEHTEHGIPNIERQMAESPEMFIQALVFVYKRSDEAEDPPEWIIPEDRKHNAWQGAYALLTNASRIPGTRDDRTIDERKLAAWLGQARTLAEAYARADVGDISIGKLLSSAPIGSDGIWPCEPVRQCLEDIGSKQIASGLAVGIYNSRGVTSRSPGDGGQQERAISSKYRNWSRQLASTFPYVARTLDEIARHYDHDAEHHDIDQKLRRRIGH